MRQTLPTPGHPRSRLPKPLTPKTTPVLNPPLLTQHPETATKHAYGEALVGADAHDALGSERRRIRDACNREL